MSRRLSAMVTRVMAMAFAAAPLGVLHSQVVAPGTSPRTDTATTTTTTTTSAGTSATPTTTTPPAPTQAAVTAEMRHDLPFIEEAASANLMEIQLGQLAQTKGSNAAVKQFGKRMVTDHRKLEAQVASMVSRNGIPLNAALNSQHQDQVNQLQNLSGQQFDQAYMSLMIQDHQADVAKFDEQSRSADSPQVRTLAGQSLPILQEHLTLAQQVGSQVNATATTTTASGNQPSKANRNVVADSKLIREIAADNSLEVAISRLAQQKAQNAAVKDFAQREVNDHTKLEDDWSRVSSQNGLESKASFGKLHREKLTRLENVSGKEFDRVYMTTEIQNHKDYIDYLQREGRAARTAEVRQAVNRSLPVLQDDFAQAKRVGAQVGANTNVTLRNEKAKKQK
jgi:putative membrane protein